MTMLRIFSTLMLLLFINFNANLLAQIDTSKIAAIVQSQVEDNKFSGTVLVCDKGQPVYHQSFGYSNLDTKTPIENHYHYSIASVTKLFTAIRVLQLIQSKKLQLHQTIDTYFPNLKIKKANKITIHHLLLHLTGLPNENSDEYLIAQSPLNMLQSTLKNKSKSKFNRFKYNNTEYMILGLLIEKITGNTWQSEIATHILKPLQMTETGFLKKGNYPKDFAYTYRYENDTVLVKDPEFYIENFYAAACMYSTSLDLLKLDQALHQNVLLDSTHYALLAKSYPEYGYAGYSVWNYKYPFTAAQPTIMERRGGILGANVVLIRLTDTNQTIIILSNNNKFDPDSFGDATNFREALIRVL